MKVKDTRRLTIAQKELVRKRVVEAVINDGKKQSEAAQLFHVSANSVSTWIRDYRAGGESALDSKKHGRPEGGKLSKDQEITLIKMIADKCPEQLKLPYMLWSREAVQQVIKHKLRVELSVWTVGRLLKKWGFTPQRPLYRAFEQDPKKVTHWLQTEYPAIKKRAKEERAVIQFGDEMGVRSNQQYGRSYAPKGKTPVATQVNKRFSCNMISSITNHGTMRFMVYEGSMTAEVFLKFLQRLTNGQKQKIFLIVDNLRVHHSKKVQAWISNHKDEIELFFLPAYSPELNPDELLNHDVKRMYKKGAPLIHTQSVFKSTLKSYLFKLQRNTKKITNFFKKAPVLYAA